MLASMIARIAELDTLPADLDADYVARHRAWIAGQPGFCGGYHLLEPETGHAMSLTMWQDEHALAAAERAMRAGQAPADGRISRQSNPTVRVVHVEAVF
jgi:heme-degrading monooxygenase HmoA